MDGSWAETFATCLRPGSYGRRRSALETSGARDRVGAVSVHNSCVRWYLSDDRTEVLVDAPASHVPTPAGAELWLWYGYDPDAHESFVDQYGFEPFE